MVRRVLALVVGALLVAGLGYPTVATLADRRAASPEVDALLAKRLAEAAPGDGLTVLAHGRSLDAAASAVERAGLRAVTTLPSIDVVVAVGAPDAVRRLAADRDLTFLEADRPLSFSSSTSHEATRGDEVRSGFDAYVLEPQPDKPGATRQECRNVRARGSKKRTVRRCETVQDPPVPQPPIERDARVEPLDGRGVTIAVVDSGVDGDHPMFLDGDGSGRSRVVRNVKVGCLNSTPVYLRNDDASRTPADMCPADAELREEAIVDVPTNRSDTGSLGGHGTHVAATAAGGPFTASDGRQLIGAAPAAKVVAVSVGYSLSVVGADAGLDWVLRHKDHPCGEGVPASVCPPIRVVNNSYGMGGGDYDPRLSIVKLSDELVRAGVVMVWAAGNEGGTGADNRNSPPAQSPLAGAISVANYDDEGTGTRLGNLESGSSRGARGRLETYPDVSAPGTDITSACRITLTVCRAGGAVESDPNVGTLTGTSMSSPHVAGIAAQLLQANPLLTPAHVEDIIEDTAFKLPTGAGYQADFPAFNDGTTSVDKGHGLVDAKAAVARARSLLLRDGPVLRPGAEACATGSPAGQVATDEAGDASSLSTDVVSARMEWRADAGLLDAVVAIANLDEGYRPPANGRAYYVAFTYGGRPFFVRAAQEAIGADGGEAVSFGLGRPEGDVRNVLVTDGMSGVVDVAQDSVTISLSSTAIDALNAALAAEGAEPVPPLGDGAVFSSVAIETFETIGAVGTASLQASDSAGGGCRFVLGSSQASSPEPAPEPGSAPTPRAAGGGDPGDPGPARDGGTTLSPGSSWTAKGAPASPMLAYECGDLGDPDCFTYWLDLSAGGVLHVSVSAFEAADYDVFVYDAAGSLVGEGVGLPLTVLEEADVDAAAARYYVVVQPYTATPQTPFTLTVSLAA